MPQEYVYVLMILSGLSIGLSKSGFGSGAGIIAVPLMALALDSALEMLGVLLPILIFGDFSAAFQYYRFNDKKLFRDLLAGGVAGIGAGWLLLAKAGAALDGQEHLLKAGIGAICILFVILKALSVFQKRHLDRSAEGFRPAAWQSVAVGIFAGLTSTLAHAAGPIISMYLLPQRLDRKVFVGTSVMFFFAVNLLKLPGYFAETLITTDTFLKSLALVPVVFIGSVLGVRLNRRMSGKWFTVVVYAITLATGINFVWPLFTELIRHTGS